MEQENLDQHNMDKHKDTSDDKIDAITAVILIAVAVLGTVYWLSGMTY
jgi:hypothetical protein